MYRNYNQQLKKELLLKYKKGYVLTKELFLEAMKEAAREFNESKMTGDMLDTIEAEDPRFINDVLAQMKLQSWEKPYVLTDAVKKHFFKEVIATILPKLTTLISVV